jgi:hypothetical protein
MTNNTLEHVTDEMVEAERTGTASNTPEPAFSKPYVSIHEPGAVVHTPDPRDFVAPAVCDASTTSAKKYWISGEGQAGVLIPAEAPPLDAACVFSRFEEFKVMTTEWPMRVLLEIWNRLPTQRRVTKFENRRIATERLWRQIQVLDQRPDLSLRQARKRKPGQNGSRKRRSSAPNKAQCIVDLLKAPGGATLARLMAASGWQSHSVRGFLSRQASKHADFKLESFKRDGQRVYALLYATVCCQSGPDAAEQKAGERD